MNGLCTPLSPSQQEHSRPRGMCGTGVCRKKAPPGEKPVAEHAAAQEAPEKKISTGPTPSAGSARNARERRQKQQNSGGGNLSLTGEQKNFQRLAHGSGKKLAMEKEADQMRRIAPRHRKERTPCPCCMAGVKGIFQLFASRPGTGSAEVRQIIPADAFGSRENSAQAGSTAGRIFRQKVSPRRKAPRTRQEEGKVP